ncbi:MAG: hypothetical protein QE285_06125, partial [Aquabacterium sp.]|nr:hypothetical protein [Aquabacterium sp.]
MRMVDDAEAAFIQHTQQFEFRQVRTGGQRIATSAGWAAALAEPHPRRAQPAAAQEEAGTVRADCCAWRPVAAVPC